jgi:hypothetical protein
MSTLVLDIGTALPHQLVVVDQLLFVVPSHTPELFTVIVMLLLVAVAEGTGQGALLVNTQLITSLVANVDVVYVELVALGMFIVFFFH